MIISACSSHTERFISSYENTGMRYLSRAKKEFSRGNMEEAFKNIDIAYSISQKYNLPYLKVYVLLEKANLFSYLKDLAQAEKFLTEAGEIINRDAKELEPYLLINLAALSFSKADIETSKLFLNQIKEPPSDMRSQYEIMISLHSFNDKNYELFEKTISKALERVKKIEDYQLEAYIHRLYADYYIVKNHIPQALESLNAALNIERFLNNREAVIYCLEKIADLYENQGGKEQAFYYYYQLWEMTSSAGDYQRSQKYLNKALEGM